MHESVINKQAKEKQAELDEMYKGFEHDLLCVINWKLGEELPEDDKSEKECNPISIKMLFEIFKVVQAINKTSNRIRMLDSIAWDKIPHLKEKDEEADKEEVGNKKLAYKSSIKELFLSSIFGKKYFDKNCRKEFEALNADVQYKLLTCNAFKLGAQKIYSSLDFISIYYGNIDLLDYLYETILRNPTFNEKKVFNLLYRVAFTFQNKEATKSLLDAYQSQRSAQYNENFIKQAKKCFSKFCSSHNLDSGMAQICGATYKLEPFDYLWRCMEENQPFKIDLYKPILLEICEATGNGSHIEIYNYFYNVIQRYIKKYSESEDDFTLEKMTMINSLFEKAIEGHDKRFVNWVLESDAILAWLKRDEKFERVLEIAIKPAFWVYTKSEYRLDLLNLNQYIWEKCEDKHISKMCVWAGIKSRENFLFAHALIEDFVYGVRYESYKGPGSYAKLGNFGSYLNVCHAFNNVFKFLAKNESQENISWCESHFQEYMDYLGKETLRENSINHMESYDQYGDRAFPFSEDRKKCFDHVRTTLLSSDMKGFFGTVLCEYGNDYLKLLTELNKQVDLINIGDTVKFSWYVDNIFKRFRLGSDKKQQSDNSCVEKVLQKDKCGM